jgi:hypothetical protein
MSRAIRRTAHVSVWTRSISPSDSDTGFLNQIHRAWRAHDSSWTTNLDLIEVKSRKRHIAERIERRAVDA